MTTVEILDAIAGMTVLEVSELVKAMEEKFGVTAAAPVAVAAGPAAGAPDEAAEEQSEFDVVLTGFACVKITGRRIDREAIRVAKPIGINLIDIASRTICERVGGNTVISVGAIVAQRIDAKHLSEDVRQH